MVLDLVQSATALIDKSRWTPSSAHSAADPYGVAD